MIPVGGHVVVMCKIVELILRNACDGRFAEGV